MNVGGTLIKIPEIKKKAPRDGVHKSDKRGYVVHPRVMLLNEKLVFFGKDCFYLRENMYYGLKVFYSIDERKFRSFNFVKKSREMSLDLCRKGYTKNIGLVLDTTILNGATGSGYSFRVQHVHVPMPAWIRYCMGYPYDWSASALPNHSIRGFKKFVNGIKSDYDVSLKLGDVGYDRHCERWYILDGNVNEDIWAEK